MKRRTLETIAAALLLTAMVAGCTGGQETTADTVKATTATDPTTVAAREVDALKRLGSISPSIPVYPGAAYRDDLSRTDLVTFRNQYGPDAQVFTLSTNDSFPQVWHYYVTYLAQYRGFQPPPPYPPQKQEWRSLQVNLNQAMQNPFIPGNALVNVRQSVILQVAETEAEPPTVVRYIVTSAPVAPASQIASQPASGGSAGPGESTEAPSETQ